nr:hypothetical protein TetV2_00299 [Oceanusvirus sp.]
MALLETSVTTLYLGAFIAAYLVTVGIVMYYAWSWRKKRDEAVRKKQAAEAAAQVSKADAANRIRDALSYQKRYNEDASKRVRESEAAAEDNLEAAEANRDALQRQSDRNSVLSNQYIAATATVSEKANDVKRAIDLSRQSSYQRQRENTDVLRKLESDIIAWQRGTVTPEEVNEAVRKTEQEIRKHAAETEKASSGFYKTVDNLLSAAEDAKRQTMEEISQMYVKKSDMDAKTSQLMGDTTSAKNELASQYEAALSRASEVEAACGVTNAETVDASTLDTIQKSYQQMIDEVTKYQDDLKLYSGRLATAESTLQGLEGAVSAAASSASSLNEQVSTDLETIETTSSENCVPATETSALTNQIQLARDSLAETQDKYTDAQTQCSATKTACESAENTCSSVLASFDSGGKIIAEGVGELKMVDGVLSFCDDLSNCTPFSVISAE